MTKQYLAEALQEVSDEHIMEATLPLRKKKKKRSWQGFAACFAVLAVCSFFAARFFSLGAPTESESAAEGESLMSEQFNGGAMTEDSVTDPVVGDGDAYGGAGSAVKYADYGVTLAVYEVTPTGLLLSCTQSGGTAEGELITGSWYVVEKYENDAWLELPCLPDNVVWTAEGWVVSPDTTTEWAVDWEWLYGELDAGEYRIGKEFLLSRAPGDYEKDVLYAEFSIR